MKEIQRIRTKYRSVAQHEEMTKDEFYALPGVTPVLTAVTGDWEIVLLTHNCLATAIAANPLRDRLFKTLELSNRDTIPFAVRPRKRICAVIAAIMWWSGSPHSLARRRNSPSSCPRSATTAHKTPNSEVLVSSVCVCDLTADASHVLRGVPHPRL